ncbi:type VI-A CRISPR-associated RNA-guided ribonuclease Cas13a [Terasakiella pusilla]|uniref:type VI-A CRISPR-associated RNA-guided ribonuclease Cas13a n=1 Tax=Terasakiella pusilla TaxID=64973 RepID=UPI003AA883E2
MKIVRSKGVSFTEKAGSDIGRGLIVKAETSLFHHKFKSARLCYSDVPAYIKADWSLLLRQIISLLDKIYPKPQNFSKCTYEGYVERSELAEALWDEFLILLEEHEGERAQELTFLLKEKWLWKIHPYAQFAYVPKERLLDQNIEKIKKRSSDKDTKMQRTQWFKVFVGDEGKSVLEVAKDVLKHLLEQEIKICGERRWREKSIKEKGLSQSRGEAISKSVSDPRNPKHKIEIQEKTYTRYFSAGEDVAEKIYKAFLIKLDELVETKKSANTWKPSKLLGQILYDYFKPFTQIVDALEKSEKEELWALHNKVRQFYAKLARGKRLKAIFIVSTSYPLTANSFAARKVKLSEVLPVSVDVLKARLAGKDENAELSELIRLGKLVAHACENIPIDIDECKLKEKFNSEMNRLVLSEGQSEIKRNESFTRIWRTSVSLSLRSLRGWIEGNGIQVKELAGGDPSKLDLTQMDIIKELIKKLGESQQQMTGLEIIFGSKKHRKSEQEETKSRVSLFETTAENQQELAWSFLRLAAEVRNKTNHFNTKKHLLSAVMDGFLSPSEKIKPFANRQSTEICQNDSKRFKSLLQFDLDLRAEALITELNRIKFTHYVDGELQTKIIKELGSLYEGNQVIVPSFGNLLKRLKGLQNGAQNAMPEWAELFTDENESSEKVAIGEFKVGILRLLYSSGFTAWLNQENENWKQNPDTGLRVEISTVLKERKKRAEAYAEDKDLFYADIHSALDDIARNHVIIGLDDLMSELSSRVYSESGLNRTYKPNKTQQSKKTGQIERFKQDLFLHLFVKYLTQPSKSFDKILSVSSAVEDASPLKPESFEFSNPFGDETDVEKLAQFYAWLYLVPPQQVALLRHQFQKSRVLEHKSNFENEFVEQLDKLGWLMSLYVHVQPIGFNGCEHNEFFSGEQPRIKMYEDVQFFDTVFSEAFEDHEISLNKTRRGLRQFIRFGHASSLNKVFEKHAIPSMDKDELRSLRQNAENLTQDKLACIKAGRDWPQAEVQEKKERQGRGELRYSSENYEVMMDYIKPKIWAAQKHRFTVEKIRLSENLKLHELYMNIISRLMDFTAIWERDKHFVLLGFLYRQIGLDALEFVIAGDPKQQQRRLCIKLPEELRRNVKNERRSGLRGNELNRRDEANYNEGYFELWTEHQGITLIRSPAFLRVLPQDEKTQFIWKRYFHEVDFKNQKYVENEQLRKAPKAPSKTKIRNDFAHFNVLDGGQGVGKTLTYQVNAVRSLMSYDRKLKNAVAKAILDILADAGVVVEWQMKADRLRFPAVYPMSSQPLNFARGLNRKFAVPQVSFRFCSMVKGLFDFSPGGYISSFVKEDDPKNKENYKQAMQQRYPSEYLRSTSQGQESMETIEFQKLLIDEYLNLLQKDDN